MVSTPPPWLLYYFTTPIRISIHNTDILLRNTLFVLLCLFIIIQTACYVYYFISRKLGRGMMIDIVCHGIGWMAMALNIKIIMYRRERVDRVFSISKLQASY